jgi:hypothetical protein
LSKVFLERGLDVFEKQDETSKIELAPDTDDEVVDEKDAAPKPMTVDELHAMRMEIMPHLLFVYFAAVVALSQRIC